MTEDAVKGIQTALWAALVLVQMGVVGCLEVRAETVHREVTYEAVEDEAALPEEIMVSVLAGHDGELVPCQAVGWVEEAAYWQDDFSFPITFYEYGAGAYQLGEITVKKTDLEDPEQLTASEHEAFCRRIRGKEDCLDRHTIREGRRYRVPGCHGVRKPAA